MPTVATKIQIPEVSLETVWEVVSDFEQYPSRMRDVVEVKYLSDSRSKSEWKVLLNGSELTWIEQDVFTPYESIQFQQIEGDLEVWEGVWSLREQEGNVIVELEVLFDLGIPSLEEMLNPVAIQAIKANSIQMLSAIKQYSAPGSLHEASIKSMD